MRTRTKRPRSRAAFVFLGHSFRHEVLHVPFSIPAVVSLDYAAITFIVARTDFNLVVVGEMPFAGNVRE